MGLTLKGGDVLQKRLADMARKLGQRGTVRAGFLEGATYPDGTSVATIAAIQNYGAPAAGIPPRPFFTNYVRANSPEWAVVLARYLKATDNDVPRALALMGIYMAGGIKDSIVATNAPPLAPATIRRKGFAKPLIDTSNLINSVDSEVVS